MKWELNESMPDFVARPLVLEIVKKYSSKDKSLLDVGCGTGRWTKKMAVDYESVVGIDSVKAMIDISKKLNPSDNITYSLVDMFELRALNKTFDVITALSVIQYSVDNVQFAGLIKQIFDSLNTGGHFVFWVPHPMLIMMNTSNWEKCKFEEGSSYFSNFPFTGKVRLTNGDWKNIGANFHSIQEYLNTLVNAGFKLVSFNEPSISKEFVEKYPDMEPDSRYPSFLVVDVVKE